jgi:hypothetical protein
MHARHAQTAVEQRSAYTPLAHGWTSPAQEVRRRKAKLQALSVISLQLARWPARTGAHARARNNAFTVDSRLGPSASNMRNAIHLRRCMYSA